MTFGERITSVIISKRAVILLLSVALLAAGIYSFLRLPIQPYPGIAPLTVQVITQWPGRSTLEVERQITVPIENALSNVPSTQAFRSVSLFGLSVVTLKFQEGSDSFRARQNILLALQSANLPNGVQPNLSPDADALGEILRYRVEGDSYDPITLKTYADWDVYRSLKHVPGVADIINFGGMVKQYQVLPKPEKMLSHGVTLNQLVTALSNANANVGGGLLPSGEQQYVVRGVGLIQSLDDVRKVIVAVNQGVPVRVGDLAEVRFGHAERLGQVQFNQQREVVEGIVLARRGENASEVLPRVHKEIDEINKSGVLPKGMRLVPFYDRQELLNMTVGTVKHTLIVGMTLVLIVLYLFLGSLRGAIIVAAVIPLALCFSFINMHFFGVPANLISLGAIDFGVIVDAGVIVLENIMRQLEHGSRTLWESIVGATAEVQRPVIFSTGIIIVAYAPLFLLGGVEGLIFQPMAFTMGFALLSSILLSLTFVPASTSVLMKEGIQPHAPRFVGWILTYYLPLLRRLIRRPRTVVLIAIGVLAVALFIASHLGTEFLPTLEENNLWVRVTLPNTVDLDYSSRFADRVREFFVKQPEVYQVAVQIGRPDDGTDATGVFNQEYGVYLKRPDEWPAGETKEDLVRRLQKYFERIPGIEYNFYQYIQDNVAEALSGVKGENSLKIFGPDLNILETKANQAKSILERLPGIVDVGLFRELGQPTLNISVDRAACARFGLNVADVENLVLYAVGGNPITTILEGERTFDLALRFPQEGRDTPEKLRRLLVDTPDGQRIPLSMVAKVELADGPFFIYRESGKRYIAVKFGVRGRDLGSAVAEAQTVISKNLQLPAGYTTAWHGVFNEMKEAQHKLAVIIPLTLLMIFLLLYLTFGRAKDAAIVLINVPFAIIGAIAALFLAGETLSISAGIGFLSLFGIAIQDGVILISYIKKLREQKGDLSDAVVEGAGLRLRPVVMTALLAGLGLLPAALSHEIGSQAQRPVALVIVGGMVSTTLLTLLVLPVIYAWANRRGSEQEIGSGSQRKEEYANVSA